MVYGLGGDLLGSRISEVLLETTADHRGTLNNEIAEIIDNSNGAAENSWVFS
jgi:hypothetical protein